MTHIELGDEPTTITGPGFRLDIFPAGEHVYTPTTGLDEITMWARGGEGGKLDRDGRDGIVVILAVPQGDRWQGVEAKSTRMPVVVGAGGRMPSTPSRAEVRDIAAHADQLAREAAERKRALVLHLRTAGLSGAEIATVLDVSPQRVSQLLNA